MIRLCVAILVFVLLCGAAFALSVDDPCQLVMYAVLQGADSDAARGQILVSRDGQRFRLEKWAVPGVPAPVSEDQLPSVAYSKIVDVPARYRKLDGDTWVEMSPAEKAAVDAAQSVASQAAKPASMKTLENNYFLAGQLLLALAEDPRVTNQPPPKLSLAELETLAVRAASNDFASAVTITVRTLAIDAVLKRYDIGWWDNAVWHDDVP